MSGKRGFTLIEVSLFLAITGLIFLGVALGVSNSISQQRNNDAVQSFAEFLRKTYSEVTNVQNATESGRSELAMYGKLIIIQDGKKIDSYSVIGKIKDIAENNTLEALIKLDANIFDYSDKDNAKLAGIPETFVPKWSSRIESIELDTPYNGALLVVRHPNSGSVFTYVMQGASMNVGNPSVGFLVNALKNGSFKIGAADYCINPDGGGDYRNRFNVRVVANARNASGVEILSPENGGNVCAK